jgi:calcium-dependent protein kinase
MVHRDIKPENIMFSQKSLNSEPKLIDFGLSNKFDTSRLRKLKTFVGTPIYLPPEVIEGDYDEKCDVWSLGALLFTLLSGTPPFTGRNKE